MSKKAVSWLDLIKLKLNEEKAKGNSPSINDIMPAAKKEWAQIKAGTHPNYVYGKAKTFARKKKSGETKKTRKFNSSSSKGSSNKSEGTDYADIRSLLAEVKICGKCKKKVEKILARKGMSGGDSHVPAADEAAPAAVGGAAASAPAGGADTVVGYDGANANSAPISGGGKKRGGKSKKQKGGCGTCTL